MTEPVPGDLVVRPVRADEADALRRIRLAALLDAPTAFSSTHAEEARLGMDEWRRRAAGTSGAQSFVAVDDDGVLRGLVAGLEPTPTRGQFSS